MTRATYKGCSSPLIDRCAHQPRTTYTCCKANMNFSTFVTFTSLSVVLAAVLDTRQECLQDNCYRAVWGDGGLSRTIQAGQDCKDFLTTSVIWNPMFVAHESYLSSLTIR
jgi:hypothetical protein